MIVLFDKARNYFIKKDYEKAFECYIQIIQKAPELKDLYSFNIDLCRKKTGMDFEEDNFILYRIIGNDLYPRHSKGQSRQNIEFILKYEQNFSNCEKRWVLNRIVDEKERLAIIDLLEKYKQDYIEIPFILEEFKKVDWDFSCLPAPGFLSSKEYFKLEPLQQDRALAATYRNKNIYLMNNNGARNAALQDGKQLAKWILPWDGNCFLTPSAWQEIIEAIKKEPYLKYFSVPMARITDNNNLLSNNFIPSPVEEPQLIFRHDAKEKFNPAYPYGRRPKVELFWRLGIPGGWDNWHDDPWDQERLPISSESKQFGVAGWVARLFSGQKELESSSTDSFKNRGLVRQDAIFATINYITQKLNTSSKLKNNYFYNTFNCLEGINRYIFKSADKAIEHRQETVVDKIEKAPSGDLNDYYHPAPYWWPNPNTLDGLPYIRRDGERVSGTIIYELESNRYDRTKLQHLFDNGIALALAYNIDKDKKYAVRFINDLSSWFINKKTKMNPHLRFAQVRRGHNNNEGSSRGVIETKDFYFYLNAVKIFEQSGALSSTDKMKFREWLYEFLGWLITSKQGVSECQGVNNHGTYYDLQVASIASFLGERELLFKTLIRARNRLSVQISPEGWQYDEMQRTQTAHYCCFNLQGWLHIAHLARSYGDNLFWHKENGVALLPQAVKWLTQHFDKPWPYKQIAEFDRDRFIPIVYLAENLGMKLNLSSKFRKQMKKVIDNKPLFHPHDGIAPYWQLITD